MRIGEIRARLGWSKGFAVLIRPRWIRRALAAAASALVCTYVLIVPTGAAQADPGPAGPAAVSEARDERAAMAAAKASGEPVEVLSERTEFAQVFARPDGRLRLEQHLLPQRAKRTDGSWTPIDTSLRRRPDGSLAPGATTVSTVLSGGGRTPFATLTDGARSLALWWPTALPEPAVTGNVATYPAVLPGVDLEVHAEHSGFSHVLVIRSAKAAENPALSQIRLQTTASGLTLRQDPSTGALSAVDSAGRVVFAGPSAVMWDSRDTQQSTVVDGERVPVPARQAPVEVRLSDGGMTLVPDRAMLTDPKTVYPVRIDPTWSKWAGGRNNFTILRKRFPGTSYWNAANPGTNDSTRGNIYAGFQDFEGAAYTERTLLEMNVSGVRYKRINKATLSMTHSWSGAGCADISGQRWVDLRVVPAFNSSTVWNTSWNSTGSGWGATLARTRTIYRYGYSCAPRLVEFTVTGAVADAAKAGKTNVFWGLKASNETDKYSWKRYKPDQKLAIEYNSTPNAPTNLKVAGKNCNTAVGGQYVTTATPNFTGSAKDVDSGQQSLTTRFYWWKSNLARNAADYVQGGSVNPGNATSSAIPSAKQLVDSQTYLWQAQTVDDVGDNAWSGACQFIADLIDPNTPASVASTTYPVYNGSPSMPGSGGVGVPGTFTIQPPAMAATDAVDYVYTLDTGLQPSQATPVGLTTPGTSASVPIAPTRDGLQTLKVWSKDRAGRFSAPYTYQFKVASVNSPAAVWTFDTTGQPGADDTGHNNTLTLGSAATTTTGRAGTGTALSVNGTSNGYATTAGPVVNTEADFTVTAWVKLNASGGSENYVAVGADGTRTAAFALGYSGLDNRWFFKVANADSDTPALATVLSNSAPVVGRWTHVAGTYVASTRQLRLWVMGVQQAASATAAADFNASQGISIGRRRWAGSYAGYLNAGIDGVHIYPFVVMEAAFDAQAAPLAPTVTFPGGPTATVGSTVQVQLNANGDTNVTAIKYSVDVETLGITENLPTPGGSTTIDVPATAIGQLRVYAAG